MTQTQPSVKAFVFPPDRFPIFPGQPEYLPLPFPADFLPFSQQSDGQRWNNQGFVITPTPEDIVAGRLETMYSAEKIQYSLSSGRKYSEWTSCTWRSMNMMHKDEHDWNMVYLCRHSPVLQSDEKETASFRRYNGLIEWRFNLRPTGMKVQNLYVRVPYKLYRDGKVRVTVCSVDDFTVLPDPQRLRSVPRAAGWDDFLIRVELTGYNSEVAFQNAQLFRQPIRQEHHNKNLPTDWADPFKVVVEMVPF